MKMPLDILFVHEGKEAEPGTKIYLMPMGLLSMADLLERSGFSARILHPAVERKLDPDFDTVGRVRDSGAQVVALDLHWHQQARAVMDLAAAIKEACPRAKILLGGYTASAFDAEILRDFPFIDFIIRGDGENPALELMKRLSSGKGLEGAANLTWRRGSKIVRSRIFRANTERDLGDFSFSNFELLGNYPLYNRRGLMEGSIDGGDEGEPGIFYCNCGRGCPYNCLFCGGSRRAQELIGGRHGFIYRPAEAMLRDLQRMGQYNLDTWYNTFHPSPDESYFLDLFREIRRRKIEISMIHECLHIPSKRFIGEFRKTFGGKSRLDFVLLSGSERLRRKNRGSYFSNEDLLRCLDLLEGHGIKADLCFLTGLPFEEPRDVRASFEFVMSARKRFKTVDVNAEVLAIEPCSIMNLEAERLGIVSHARTFMDYYRGHAGPGFVGYTPERFTAAEAGAIAEHLKAAFRCPSDVCLFASAILDDFSAVSRLPVDEWKEPCRSCGDFSRCFPPENAVQAPAARPAGIRGGSGQKRRIVLSTVNLWDDGMRYGLGAPFLMSYARSRPGIDETFELRHLEWPAQVPGGKDPTARQVASRIIARKPFMAGFTMVSWSEKVFAGAIGIIRREAPGVKIAVGGPLASAWGPQMMRDLPGIDYLVCGYGELPFAAMLEAFAAGRDPGPIPGLYSRVGGKVSGRRQSLRDVLPPDRIPSPFRAGLVDLSQAVTMHVEWARGCPGNCAYCSWGNETRSILQCSGDRIVDDIAWALQEGVGNVSINTSAVNFDTGKLASLCGAVLEGDPERRIEFTGFLRYEYLDERQMEILRRVRWKSLITGLQTDDPRGLRIIGRPPLDRKKFEWAVSEISKFTRPGVQIITAIPGDSFGKFEARLEWLLGLDCDITVFPLQVARGTRMWRERGKLGISPDLRRQYWVYGTPTMGAGEHLRCLRAAAGRLEETSMREGKKKSSHGVAAGPDFGEGIAEAARIPPGKDAARPARPRKTVFPGRSHGKERISVQLHHVNVYDGGMHFGLGVPFLIAHCRLQPGLEGSLHFEQVDWNLGVPGCPDPTPREVLSRILADPPRVAGFSLQPWSRDLFLETIKELKKARPEVTTVVGGPNAVLLGGRLLKDVPQIDALFSGEGEIPFAQFLEALISGKGAGGFRKIGGMFFREGGKIAGRRAFAVPAGSLDYCGRPAGEGLVRLSPGSGLLYFEWTRGCPNQCAYCSWPRQRHGFRRFSRQYITADIRWALAGGHERIMICDSAINYSDGLLEDLCDTLAAADPGRGMSYGVFLQYYLVTRRQIDLMRPVRWFRIMTGLQTDDREGLRILGRPRFDRKQFEKSLALMKTLTVPYVDIMSGVPGDTAVKLRRRLDYLLGLGCRVTMFPLLATPGTGLWNRRGKLGLVIDPGHQYVVREIPTMAYDEYRKTIEYAFSLNLPREEFEIVGYDFMGFPRAGAGETEGRAAGAPAGELDMNEFRSRLDALIRKFREINATLKRKGGAGAWFSVKGLKDITQAHVSGMRVAFAHARGTIEIDVFRASDISMPVARGRSFAFCTFRGGQTELSGEEYEEAAMLLCRALAKIDL
jgi:radical SAM superfamily enzyme YgiQ (UPF0313 family)